MALFCCKYNWGLLHLLRLLRLQDAQTAVPEDTYQATFDTTGDWTTVRLPWHAFVPVKRARSLPGGPPLDPAVIRQFGLVLSRFEYNGYANPAYHSGPFELLIDGGIRAYRDPRPQLLMVSSGGWAGGRVGGLGWGLRGVSGWLLRGGLGGHVADLQPIRLPAHLLRCSLPPACLPACLISSGRGAQRGHWRR